MEVNSLDAFVFEEPGNKKNEILIESFDEVANAFLIQRNKVSDVSGNGKAKLETTECDFSIERCQVSMAR